MKLVLVTTAVLAFSASAAFAGCPAHNAESKMDKPQTTASIQATVPTQK